jgi:hypothetical protein
MTSHDIAFEATPVVEERRYHPAALKEMLSTEWASGDIVGR